MKKAIFLVLILFTSICKSQSDFRKGFIVKSKGDTIYGMIDFRGDIRNSNICTFKDSNENDVDYFPFDIQEYKFENNKYYVSKILKKHNTPTPIFAEYLVKGKKNLYKYRDESGDHILLDLDKDTVTIIPFTEKIIKIEDPNIANEYKYVQYSSTKHIGYLKSYFNDQPTIFDEIESIKKPSPDNITLLAKEYNTLSNSIVYCKVKPKFKMALEPIYGKTTEKGSNSYYSQYGFLAYLWMPSWNENLYFKTGIVNINIDDSVSLFKIPVKLEYQFPFKYIKPKFNFGFNIYSAEKAKALTASTSAGGLIKITKGTFLDVSVETDLFQLAYKARFFIFYSFNTGVFISF